MMTRGASKQTRKLSSGLSRLSEEIIQTSQQMKEKRLRSETVQKTREETEVQQSERADRDDHSSHSRAARTRSTEGPSGST